MHLLSIAGLGYGELLIVVGVIVLLFGATKIPTLMRSMGQGIGEFKKGLKEGQVDEEEQKRLQKSADEAKARTEADEKRDSEKAPEPQS